jgi:hypothetical protein
LEPEKHRAVLFLLVAIEVEMGERFGVLIHEEMEIEEGLHTAILARDVCGFGGTELFESKRSRYWVLNVTFVIWRMRNDERLE